MKLETHTIILHYWVQFAGVPFEALYFRAFVLDVQCCCTRSTMCLFITEQLKEDQVVIVLGDLTQNSHTQVQSYKQGVHHVA